MEPSFDIGQRGCFRWWVSNRRPFLLDPAAPPDFATGRETEEARQFGLGLIAAHGVIDPLANCGSYLSFAGVSPSDPFLMRKLEIIAPTLHALFLGSMGGVQSRLEQVGLTPRQIEIVRLAARGLDDKQIARELAISEHTVANHLRGVFQRLGIRRRSQLAMMLR